MPNQLIQKHRKDSDNLCKTCSNQESCNDYKYLKYVDICDDYLVRNLCSTYVNKETCKFSGSSVLSLNCAEYNVGVKSCPICQKGKLTLVVTDSNGTLKECSKCGYKERNIGAVANNIVKRPCPKCKKENSLEWLGGDTYKCRVCGYNSEEDKKVVVEKVTIEKSKTFLEILQSVKFDKGIKNYENLKTEYNNVVELLKGHV